LARGLPPSPKAPADRKAPGSTSLWKRSDSHRHHGTVSGREQLLATPGAGSPNTLLVHAVPLVNVLTTNEPFAPYRTFILPVNAHTPPSGAQNVHCMGGGVGAVLSAHCFGVSGAGSPNTLLVHAVSLVNVLTTNEPFAP